MPISLKDNNLQSVNFSIDIEKLFDNIAILKQIEKEAQKKDQKEFKVRSTVFSVGKDSRLSSLDQISAPDLFLIELLKDQLKQIFVRLNWKVSRFDIDSGQIIGFNVYRRRILGLSSKKLNVFDFSKLYKNLKKSGKFSFDKKGIANTKKGIIPLEILNPNLFQEQKWKMSQSINKGEKPELLFSEIESLFANKFEKIAYVNYEKFIGKEKQKRVFISDANFATLSFDDKKINYRDTYEYYLSSVTKTGEETYQSDTVRVLIVDNRGIGKPSIIAKQVDENNISLSVRFEESDRISKVITMKKAENEVVFRLLSVVNDVGSDKADILDSNARYSKTYVYRIFTENIDGVQSDPAEITVYSSAHRITDKGRMNNLKIPIMTAVQDENSGNAKITIFSNDPLILYYQLERRDLSIGEKRFSSPSKTYTNFGEPEIKVSFTNWSNNKFFVDKKNLSEIVFLDGVVSVSHIYQYRVQGFDVYGNTSSYAFAMIKIENKKLLRSPIDVRVEVLRQFPIRIKLSYMDDNIEIDKNVISFLVQRRKNGEIVYESFPATKNNFIVDEGKSDDVIEFSTEKIEDIFETVPNIEINADNILAQKERKRSFGMPGFLEENDSYYYRIKTITNDGQESNFTEELKVSTLADLSEPLNFRAIIDNVKIRPLIIRLNWETDKTKLKPDHWTIERRLDDEHDNFKLIGRSYLQENFFDRNVELGRGYIYRIKSVDSLKRESIKIQTRVAI